MKFACLISLLCCSALFSIAQTGAPDFTLGVIMPDATADFSDAQLQKLEAKLIQMINHSGKVVAGYNNDFVMYPVLSLGETGVVSGGMENMTVTTVELTLQIRQLSSKTVFNSFTKNLKGSGSNLAQSISNAFSAFSISDNSYAQFISATKDKALKYYQVNCNQIIQSALSFEARKDYEQAVSLLQSIPYGTPCYNEAKKKALQVYVKNQNNICAKLIANARGEMAIQHYVAASDLLALVEPGSACSAEATRLMSQVEAKVGKQEKREYDLDVLRINAIKEIGKAYFSGKARSRRR